MAKTYRSPGGSSSSSPLHSLMDAASGSPTTLVTSSPAELVETPLLPPRKSRRTEVHEPPSSVDTKALPLPEEGAATAANQQRVASEKSKAWSLMELQIVEDGRSVPSNFDSKVHEAYLRLPSILLPAADAKMTGKYNYTLVDANKSTIQVQLLNKVFYITKDASVTWDKQHGSPQVPWSAGGTIQNAWELTIAKLSKPWSLNLD